MLRRLGYGLGHGCGRTAPPVNTAAPIISGTQRAGQTLSATTGTWSNAPALYAYQWKRDGANISGATNNTYVLTSADAGRTVKCTVTATNAGGSAAQDSNSLIMSAALDFAAASAVFDLDATLSASYGGSGQTWANLVAAPADGSGQTAYDFYLGADNAATSDDPAFTGSAGSAAAYFVFDGGDYFRINANTAFLNNLAKTTGGADFTMIVAGRLKTGAAFQPLLSTLNTTGTDSGVMAYLAGTTNVVTMWQRGGASVTAGSGVAISDAADYVVIASHSHGTNKTRFWINSATGVEQSHTFSTTTTNGGGKLTAGAMGSNGNPVVNGTRYYTLAMLNEFIDDAKAAAIFAHLETRHGRDYTP